MVIFTYEACKDLILFHISDNFLSSSPNCSRIEYPLIYYAFSMVVMFQILISTEVMKVIFI